MKSESSVNRYSDADLAEFKDVIDKKLATAYEELNYIQEQISNTTETMEKDGDWMEESSNYSDLEMMQTMAHRLTRHIQNLENALLRIKNKSYGICVVTGELIDKRRLLAVPTTTQSLTAKQMTTPPPKPEPSESRPVSRSTEDSGPKIITKVVQKPSESGKSSKIPLDDLYLFDEDDADAADGPVIDSEMLEISDQDMDEDL